MIGKLCLIVALLMAIGGANWLMWRSVQAPAMPQIATPLPAGSVQLDWALLMSASKGLDHHWRLPPALVAYEGRTVTLDGVLFAMPQLVRDHKMEGAVLTPPSKFGCCGLSCTTQPQLMMFLDLPVPLPVPATKTVACRATGVLRLNRDDGSWTMSELSGARLEFP
jgi:hypothetical protein